MDGLLRVEKLAICAGLLLFATGLAGPYLFQRLWVFWILIVGLIWLMVLGLAASSVISAARDADAETPRLRAGLAFPLAIATVFLLGALGVPSWTSAWIHLQLHSAELAELESRTAGKPIAIDYVDGIPDGGAKIIRSQTDPQRLPVSEHLRLTGERIHSCRKLTRRDWLCGYD